MDIRSIKLADLQPAAYNPRKKLSPGSREYESIKNSILTFGYNSPMIVNIRNGKNTIVSGHQRYQILLDMGIDEAECSIVDYDEATEKACNIAANKVAGDWDFDLLTSLLTDLQSCDFDTSVTGFDFDCPTLLDDTGLEQVLESTDNLMDDIAKKPKQPKAVTGSIVVQLTGPLNQGDVEDLRAKYYGRGVQVEVINNA